jgi:hypothetical protein
MDLESLRIECTLKYVKPKKPRINTNIVIKIGIQFNYLRARRELGLGLGLGQREVPKDDLPQGIVSLLASN